MGDIAVLFRDTGVKSQRIEREERRQHLRDDDHREVELRAVRIGARQEAILPQRSESMGRM